MLEPPDHSQEVVEWLVTLHLSQYASCFQQGGYESLEDCKDLTDEHLLELQVLPTGHRRRILRSLEALGIRQSGENDEAEGGIQNQRHGRKLWSRHVLNTDKKRMMSFQKHPPKDKVYNLEGSQTLPPGAGLATEIEDVPENRNVSQPQPALCSSQNDPTSIYDYGVIPASVSSCSSSSSETFSIPEVPSDWEISPEHPSLSITDSIPGAAEVLYSSFTEDKGSFGGEMVENSIYEMQPSSKVATSSRLSRSFRLRHRPVPEIPDLTIPALRAR